MEGETGIGTSLVGTKTRGSGRMELGEVLLGGSPGDAPFWAGDVGGDPPYVENLGGFNPLYGKSITGKLPVDEQTKVGTTH